MAKHGGRANAWPSQAWRDSRAIEFDFPRRGLRAGAPYSCRRRMTNLTVTGLARWVDISAAMLVLGSALYPLYAPTGRFLDRPLRHVVIAASVIGVIAALAWVGSLLFELAGADASA